MLRPKCEICGEPAVIHETAVADEGAVTWHFCQDHGQAAMLALILRPQANQAAGEHFGKLSEREKEHFAMLYHLTHNT